MDLKSIRKAKGRTMKQIAEASGVTEGFICLIEKGDRSPSVKAAKRIAPAYGIKWEDFFNGEEA